MAEWSIAAVLKTVELQGSGGSNPSSSADAATAGDGNPVAFLIRPPSAHAPTPDQTDREQADNDLLTLHGFSESAEKSLQVNSPWFMSALLYPEDYREGEPNNLEKLIQSL